MLIAGFGLGSPFVVLFGLYFISLALSFKLPKTEPKPPTGTSALREIGDGLKYIKSDPVLLRITILTFSIIFNATLVPIIPSLLATGLKWVKPVLRRCWPRGPLGRA